MDTNDVNVQYQMKPTIRENVKDRKLWKQLFLFDTTELVTYVAKGIISSKNTTSAADLKERNRDYKKWTLHSV